MFVGVLRLSLRIPAARSLKDRRRVVLSFKERTQARFRVSVAEVGNLDDPRYATLAVAVVSNEASHCDSVLSSVASAAGNLGEAILLDWATEVLPFGEGGKALSGGLEQRASAGEQSSRARGQGVDDAAEDEET